MMKTSPQLCLASTSPRRREILSSLGLEFTVQSVSVDETPFDAEPALDLVLRLAEAKATAADSGADLIVIAADTVVVLDDQVLGKPCDELDAIDMLMRLAGREHAVVTGVAVKSPQALRVTHSSTDVLFREIDRDEASRYWHSGEPCDKAGAYGIQGLGGLFVAAIHGSYSGVVGLPVFETAKLLQQAGVDVLVSRT